MTKSVDNVAVALLLERARRIVRFFFFFFFFFKWHNKSWGGFCQLSGTAVECFNIYGREGHFKHSFGV